MSGIVGSRFNIRGSGLVGSLGTDGQVFTSSGAGKSAVYEAAAAGGLVPLAQSSGTSGTANVIVNGWITDTYENYVMDYYMTPVTNNVDIYMTLYDSSGNLSGTEYDYVTSGITSSNGSAQDIYDQGQGAFKIGTSIHNDTGRIGMSGRMIWLHPRVASKRTHILHEFQKTDYGATVLHLNGVLAYKGQEAITGFYISASSGNMTHWSIRCYGIVNS